MNAHSLADLVGTWRLLSCEARTSSGEMRHPFGQHFVGQLFYDVRGNMSAHVMKVDRPRFTSDDVGRGTDAEVRAAFEGRTSYFGTYTVNPSARTVIHHVHGASYRIGWVTTSFDTTESTVLVLYYPRHLFWIARSHSSTL